MYVQKNGLKMSCKDFHKIFSQEPNNFKNT